MKAILVWSYMGSMCLVACSDASLNIVVNPSSVDLGRVFVGDSVETGFSVTNPGINDLVIQEWGKSCSCQRVAMNGREMLPDSTVTLAGGEQGRIEVTTEIEEGSRAVTVHAVVREQPDSTSTNTIHLSVQYVGVRKFLLTPETVDFGTVVIGVQVPVKFAVETTDESPFAISFEEKWGEFERISQSRYRFTGELTAEELGPFFRELRFSTDLGEFKIPVAASVVRAVRLSTRFLNFGVLDRRGDGEVVREVTLQGRDDYRVVDAMYISQSRHTFEVEVVGPRRVQVRHKGTDEVGPVRGRVEIVVSDGAGSMSAQVLGLVRVP